MLNSIRFAVRAAHEYVHPNPLAEEVAAKSEARRVSTNTIPALPAEIVQRITAEARNLYFNELSPKYAALAAATLAADAKFSPNLHKYLRENTLPISNFQDHETASMKLAAFRALAHNLPAVNREPGEVTLSNNQRAIGRAFLFKLLDERAGGRFASSDVSREVRRITQSRLEALAETAHYPHEWINVCSALNRFLDTSTISTAEAARIVSRLAEKIPAKAQKHAFVSLAQIYSRIKNVAAEQLQSVFERHLRPQIDKVEPSARAQLFTQFDLSPASRRSQLLSSRSALTVQRARIEAELRELEIR